MTNSSGQKIQMGTLTSEITVIDEDALLTPAQLERITMEVMRRVEQKLQVQQQREQDQAIQQQAFDRQEWLR
ncbi:hypothetical protein [Pleionea sp. CnH1-48]|uniref:hypothetical protein n=1 Tax=Pleionea sp. CnH1-48 TaxID=2954494 RepID=UPI0020985F9F|nr:hypothetical protein [Pleionea sp. CnH1-48]MCO7223329.1 hypothetical protein [Pleionea sp. CnH1-48]